MASSGPPIGRIGGVLSAVIYAKDPERLASFYAHLVQGDAQVSPDGRFVTLTPTGGAFELHVVAAGDEVREQIQISDPPTPRTDTPIKLVIDVEVTEALQDLVGAAGGVLSPPGDSWTWRGMVHRDGVDPEGNVFQLRSPA